MNNQKISILDVTGKNIVNGTYYTKDDGYSYIDGTCYIDNNYNQTTSFQGLLKVSNKANGVGITVGKKESTNLSIHLVDITYYKNEDAILQKLPDGNYSYKETYAKSNDWSANKKSSGLRITVKKEDWVGIHTMEVPIFL